MRSTFRHGTFETNSSSVHALAIGQTGEYLDRTGTQKVDLGEYGWEYDEWVDPLPYLLTGAECLGELEEWKSLIKEVCGFDVETFYEPDSPYSGCYVDHASELREFLDACRRDPQLLYSFIMDKASHVETGNDNDVMPRIIEESRENGEEGIDYWNSSPYLADDGCLYYFKDC